MRGSPPLLCEQRMTPGSIPASAGQPVRRGVSVLATTVYPRECGAAPLQSFPPHDTAGLSPRVRGSQAWRDVCRLRLRSIPASAGQPILQDSMAAGLAVYPRECGAASLASRRDMAVSGLSPRVRGSPPVIVSIAGNIRSIPASAGQPSSGDRRRCSRAVYPRECGAAKAQASRYN